MIKTLRRWLGIFVGKFVLKSQLIPIGELQGLRYLSSRFLFSRQERERLNNLWPEFLAKNESYKKNDPQKAVNIKRQLLTTPDGSKLDTVELSPRNANPKEYVIYGWGRNNHYEMFLSRLAGDAINMNKKVITFNYRNVGASLGQVASEYDLIKDYKFQIERLLAKGVKPEQIKCYGHSLGGAVATFSVYDLHRNNKKGIKLFNDRSFGNLIDTSVALFFKRQSRRRRFVNRTTMILTTLAMMPLLAWTTLSIPVLAFSWLGVLGATTLSQRGHAFFDKIVGTLLEQGLRMAMHGGNWYMNVANKYDSLPMADKTHMILKQPKANRSESKVLGKSVLHTPSEDRVIFYADSLHKHAVHYKDQIKTLKNKLLKQHNALDKHKLLELSMVKVSGGDHNAPPAELKTWYKHHHAKRHITGQERLYHLFDPQGGHLSPKPKKYKNY